MSSFAHTSFKDNLNLLNNECILKIRHTQLIYFKKQQYILTF